MKKILGIIFFILLLNSPIPSAGASSLPLKENLIEGLNFQESSVKNIKQENSLIVKTNNTPIIFNEKILNMALPQPNNFAAVSDEIIYKDAQTTADLIDPAKQNGVNSYYPGMRGPNQLIIYTPAYGYRTGTNEFGTEAIVENNMVVSLNGADSVIPKNGFVLSGHGAAKKWLNANVQVGSKVYFDPVSKIINVVLTPESLVFAAKEKLAEVNKLIEYYKNIDILYNDKKAAGFLEESKENLRKAEKKPEKTQHYVTEAMNSLNQAIKNAIPYNDKELKGVWLRPVETTPAEIEKTVEKIHNAGITDIFLETYFHGKTIYPSKYLKQCGVISQREEFVGFDPLEVWIKEAHKRRMKIHIWFETYYVGNDNPQTTPNHVLSVYPLWSNKRLMNYDSTLPVSSLSEHNGYFLDPSNLQVQTYLTNILKEIVETYKPDGINLDYIRYPQTVDPSFPNYAAMSWGYTAAAREEFKMLYGIDPVNIKYGTGDWELWSLYRQNQIAEFVKEAGKITRPAGVMLTAVIFPDLKKSVSTKMQNWKMWSFNNYVDGLTPLILTGDKNTADILIKDVKKNVSPVTNIYPGIFVTFMGAPFDDLLMQIHKTREFKTKGAILFDYAHLNEEYVEALTTRVYNNSYDPRDVKVKSADVYAPQVKYGDKKKKRFWRRKNGNN